MAGEFRTTARSVRYRDGFSNLEARLGLDQDNLMSASRYTLTPISRNRQELDNMYRSAWIVRQVVGVVAEDMTKAGVELKGINDPGDQAAVYSTLGAIDLWGKLEEAAKWGRLYGGSIAVMMIDGQSTRDPLRPETVRKGQFKGVVVYDRWQLTPSSEKVSQPGPDFGKPVNYLVNVKDVGMPQPDPIHHTRVIRFEGDDLPHFQRLYEMGWGMSVVEPFYDRLVAFDSTTMGTAQMVYKAWLRTVKLKNFRANIAQGGKAYEAQISQIDIMRRYQSAEGMTILDADDSFETQSYNFGGLAEVLIQMSQQIAGATGIPVVKLFGMSPAGFSTGETDLRSYYDNVSRRQNRSLRHPMRIVLEVAHYSALGRAPENDFDFSFAPMWELSSTEKASVATQVAGTVVQAESMGIIKRSTALKELKNLSRATGVFGSIEDEDIDEAVQEEQIPELPQAPMPGEEVQAPPAESAVSDPETGAAEEQAGDEPVDRPSVTQPGPVSAPARPRLVGL